MPDENQQMIALLKGAIDLAKEAIENYIDARLIALTKEYIARCEKQIQELNAL